MVSEASWEGLQRDQKGVLRKNGGRQMGNGGGGNPEFNQLERSFKESLEESHK